MRLSVAMGWKLAACGSCGVDDDLRFGSCFDCSPHVVARASKEKGYWLVRDKKSGKRWKAKMHGDPVKLAQEELSGEPLVPEEKRVSPSGAEAAQDDHDENDGWSVFDRKLPIEAKEADKGGTLVTLEGPAKYNKGDMIARGARGEKWPIKREIFEETYEKRGATSLLAGHSKIAGFSSFLRDTADEFSRSPRIQETVEPIRKMMNDAKRYMSLRRMLLGGAVAAATGVGVAYLDRKHDETLSPH
jgi:hypothetical protein